MVRRAENEGYFKIVGYNWTMTPYCPEFGACLLNKGRVPVKTAVQAEFEERISLEDAVTVIIKTANRLGVTKRLVESIFQFYENLKIIVVDEANPELLRRNESFRKEYDEWRHYTSTTRGKVYYIQVQKDAGISHGRNVGLFIVRTKYFLLLDDDMIFDKETNIRKLKELLDHTNLVVVGGFIRENRIKLAINGIFRVHADQFNVLRTYINEYQLMAYDRVRCYPECYVVDAISNFFLARTDAILDVGGWDVKLRVGEHRDFMLTLRKNNYPVAVCTDVIIEHFPPNLDLRKKAQKVIKDVYKDMFLHKWNISNSFACRSIRSKAYYEYRCKP
ncbi:beta-1,4 N-acetylgalactosaminyltransferase 1 [Lingula anatina]|uniref:Beta-1,4 N-acetylgalactosaminyltransferase 1 n=1 Tax=Lingula anatina TaxID=7574 RepID=A0A1S3H7Z5_LINAN|nr:beta-1,4 N-acetylgalactosaminyltransferase 1 [Lingula anatina]|eukprot:XP_013382102.1 beta-1,4 N-acetylgalactosaminyltransferase 1 [Lingula anatina]